MNGEQDYVIMLGPSESADPLYHGIEIDDVPMRGIALWIAAPDPLHPFYPAVPGQLRPVVRYSGQDRLSFTLTAAPEGMTVDLGTGTMAWTPDDDDAGKTFTVTLSATDGGRFATATFEVSVAEPEPVETRVVNGRLTVTEADTTLNGLSIATPGARASGLTRSESQSGGDLSSLQIEIVEPSQVPAFPDRVSAMSDFFLVRQPYTEPVELRFPLRNLSPGTDVRDVSLYSFGDVTDVGSPVWSPVFVEIDFEVSGSELVVVISGEGLQGLYVFGIVDGAPTTAQPAASTSHVPERSSGRLRPQANGDVTCEPRPYSYVSSPIPPFFIVLPVDDYEHQTCSHPDGAMIKVKGFGSTANAVRWGSVRIEDLVQWLVDAQNKFEDYNLGYDDDITVHIHRFIFRNRGALGYVSFGLIERGRTLHLTADNSQDPLVMKGTAVHEYFHHAQGHADTKVGEGELLIFQGDETLWMTEGSARWFEDELYDDDNSYEEKEGVGERILEVGLNAVPDEVDERKRPYQRFSFLKALSGTKQNSTSKRCSDFDNSLRGLLTVDESVDPSGIRGLSNALQGASCNFGNHLGPDMSDSLAAAMVLYQYATLFENDMRLLDAEKEPATSYCPSDTVSFCFYQPTLQLAAHAIEDFPLLKTLTVPAASAQTMSLFVLGVDLPAGNVAEIATHASSGPAIVSLWSSSPDFEPENTIQGTPHAWFDTRDPDGHVFARGSRFTGHVYVTVVNPSLSEDVDVTVTVLVRDPDAEVEITSHADGDTVNNRVVSIRGNVSPEIRGDVDRVVVTANGIDTVAQVSADGSFTADVVVALGDNLVEARAFQGATPVSGRAVLNLQGVESGSRGRNALLASRIALVLRWDTPSNDVDLYSTARDGTLWYRNLSQGSGSLDHDDTSGYGPEVISYRATDSDVYVNGQFSVDVHYYRGSAITNYTLDLVLNETQGNLRRLRRFQSIVPLTESTGTSGNGPDGPATATSRFNDVLRIGCNAARICSLSGYDASKLVQRGLSGNLAGTDAPSPMRARSVGLEARTVGASSAGVFQSSYETCREELEAATGKHGDDVSWSCNADGTKYWH